MKKYKIKIKDSCPYGSISNRFFNIEKGDIVEVDEKFPFNDEVFEKVSDEVKIIEELTEDEIKEILTIDYNPKKETTTEITIKEGKAKTKHELPQPIPLTIFKQRISEKNLKYNQLQQLLEAEKKGEKRVDFIDFLKGIPEAKDEGINVTENTMLMSDLRSIKFVTDKAVHLIAKTFKNKEEFTKALKDGHKLFKKEEYRNDFNPNFMEHAKKHFGLIKSVVTTKEVFRRGRKSIAMPIAQVPAIEIQPQ